MQGSRIERYKFLTITLIVAIVTTADFSAQAFFNQFVNPFAQWFNRNLQDDFMADQVVEPARAPLNPHLKEAETAALKAGASGAFLGGSGPCVIAIYDRKKADGEGIAEAVRDVYSGNGIKSDTWVTTWGEGCRRL